MKGGALQAAACPNETRLIVSAAAWWYCADTAIGCVDVQLKGQNARQG